VEILRAIVLGIVQGLTEFLPVSSSGHLEIAKALLNDPNIDGYSMLMTVVLHGATALATVFVFKKDISKIIKGLFSNDKKQLFFSIKIILSMIPAVFVGLFFETEIEALFEGKLLLVGCMLFVTGTLLFLADKANPKGKGVGIKDALIIGVSQAIAILPGMSRSGATISTSVLLGIDKEKSARFSFLMVVPLILGKMAKDLFSGEILEGETPILSLGIGFFFAFITGMIACKWMLKIVKNSQLKYFAFYCFVVGLITIIFL
jgi:undecaprenyl-diphosphatase